MSTRLLMVAVSRRKMQLCNTCELCEGVYNLLHTQHDSLRKLQTPYHHTGRSTVALQMSFPHFLHNVKKPSGSKPKELVSRKKTTFCF